MKFQLGDFDWARLEPLRVTFCSRDLERLAACPGSGVFRGPPDQPVHPAAWYGIFVHRFLENAQLLGRDGALAALRRKAERAPSARRALRTCEGVDVSRLPAGEVEVAWAEDVQAATSRRLGPGDELDRERDSFGKADLVFRDRGGAAHVVDWKTGKTPEGPATRPQLWGLARSIALATYARVVRMSVVAVRAGGELSWETVEATRDMLDDFGERQRRVHLRVAEARAEWRAGVVPELVPGDHCRWCNCRALCPALARAA